MDLSAMFMAFAGVILVVILLVIIAFYIYSSLAWMTIGKKLKYKYPWLAWIPIANTIMVLQMGGFSWAWIILGIVLPIIAIIPAIIFAFFSQMLMWIVISLLIIIPLLILCVISIIATWRIYEKRKYPGWLALVSLLSAVPYIGMLAVIANIVILGLVAWSDRK